MDTPDIHPLIADRRSPYAFDADKPVNTQDLTALFNAARWAASSYNAQPWRYIVGVREHDEPTWQKVFDALLEGNQPWAANAPVLALGLVQPHFEHNGKPNKAALHDLGAAAAQLTLEATARGLVVHQMIGIDPEKARGSFQVPAHLDVVTGLAIGYAGSADAVPEAYAQRDASPRTRKPLTDIIFAGGL